MTMPQAHCWYSPTQAKTWGYCYYKLTSGEVVEVTVAASKLEDGQPYNFADAEYLGQGDWFADGVETQASLSMLQDIDSLTAKLYEQEDDRELITEGFDKVFGGFDAIQKAATKTRIEQN